MTDIVKTIPPMPEEDPYKHLRPIERVKICTADDDDGELIINHYADGSMMLIQGEDRVHLTAGMLKRVKAIASWGI